MTRRNPSGSMNGFPSPAAFLLAFPSISPWFVWEPRGISTCSSLMILRFSSKSSCSDLGSPIFFQISICQGVYAKPSVHSAPVCLSAFADMEEEGIGPRRMTGAMPGLYTDRTKLHILFHPRSIHPHERGGSSHLPRESVPAFLSGKNHIFPFPLRPWRLYIQPGALPRRSGHNVHVKGG